MKNCNDDQIDQILKMQQNSFSVDLWDGNNFLQSNNDNGDKMV